MGKAILYICTRVSDSNKIYKSQPRSQDEWTADARAGKIVTSHKLQILCENEPRASGVLDGTPLLTAFSTREGQISLLPLLVMHMRDPLGRNGRKSSITKRTGGHDEPSCSQEGEMERADLLTNLMADEEYVRPRHYHRNKSAHSSMCSIEEDFELVSARWRYLWLSVRSMGIEGGQRVLKKRNNRSELSAIPGMA